MNQVRLVYTRTMPNHLLIKTILLLLTTGILCTTSSAQNYVKTDPFDASISALQRGLRAGPDKNHHAVLLTLRKLRDPNMKPLFQRLLDSSDPALQIDGLLALAEIKDGPIDPFLLKQFSPRDRMIAIIAAIDLELLDARSIETILDFEDLQPVEKLNLMVHGRSLGIPFDRNILVGLQGTDDPVTRAVVAILLAEIGEPSQFEGVIAEYPGHEIAQRERIANAVSDLATQKAIASSVSLLELIWADNELSRGTRLLAIDAALTSETAAGKALWIKAGREARTSGDRMRLGVMGLDHVVDLEDWGPFRDERAFTKLIAASGEARNAGDDLAPTAVAMVTKKNAILIEGALSVAKNAPPEQALEIRKAIIKLAIEKPEIRAIGMRVITEMAEEHPSALDSVLTSLKDPSDPGLGEMGIMGLLNADAIEAMRTGWTFRDHPDRRVRTLSLLLKVRSGDPLDKDELEELGDLASGAGGVDSTIRAMAAWMWLDRTDNRERAVTRIVGDA